jgi:hypothetical protein
VISSLSGNDMKDAECLKTARSEDPPPGGCGLIGEMVRRGETAAGQRIAEKVRPPIMIYSTLFNPDLGAPPFAFGATARVDELFHLILDALERRGGS